MPFHHETAYFKGDSRSEAVTLRDAVCGRDTLDAQREQRSVAKTSRGSAARRLQSQRLMPKAERQVLRGKVIALNISPKGHFEGALVETKDGVAQLNFGKHDEERLGHELAVGQQVDIDTELEHDDGDHLVYRAAPTDSEVTGTIARFNYALHGEINGYQLDDGTLVHVKPDGAKKYGLKTGQKITAQGTRRVGASAVVLDAREVRTSKSR